MNQFTHTDLDGDFLKVWGGNRGAVIFSADHHVDSISTLVAVRFDKLPELIATLQAILNTDPEATK